MIEFSIIEKDNSTILQCVCFPQIIGDFIVFITKGNFQEWEEAKWIRQSDIKFIYQYDRNIKESK